MFSVQKNSFNTASDPYNPSISLIFVVACKKQTNIVDILSAWTSQGNVWKQAKCWAGIMLHNNLKYKYVHQIYVMHYGLHYWALK